MRKYQEMAIWKVAHQVALITLRECDRHYHPRSRGLFDQLRRAAVSVEANFVEGYALGTPALYRRHLRIALGSAAEAECLVRVALEAEYLPMTVIDTLTKLLDQVIAMLFVMVRARAS